LTEGSEGVTSIREKRDQACGKDMETESGATENSRREKKSRPGEAIAERGDKNATGVEMEGRKKNAGKRLEKEDGHYTSVSPRVERAISEETAVIPSRRNLGKNRSTRKPNPEVSIWEQAV